MVTLALLNTLERSTVILYSRSLEKAVNKNFVASFTIQNLHSTFSTEIGVNNVQLAAQSSGFFNFPFLYI